VGPSVRYPVLVHLWTLVMTSPASPAKDDHTYGFLNFFSTPAIIVFKNAQQLKKYQTVGKLLKKIIDLGCSGRYTQETQKYIAENWSKIRDHWESFKEIKVELKVEVDGTLREIQTHLSDFIMFFVSKIPTDFPLHKQMIEFDRTGEISIRIQRDLRSCDAKYNSSHSPVPEGNFFSKGVKYNVLVPNRTSRLLQFLEWASEKHAPRHGHSLYLSHGMPLGGFSSTGGASFGRAAESVRHARPASLGLGNAEGFGAPASGDSHLQNCSFYEGAHLAGNYGIIGTSTTGSQICRSSASIPEGYNQEVTDSGNIDHERPGSFSEIVENVCFTRIQKANMTLPLIT
jgi:hypothetical protein